MAEWDSGTSTWNVFSGNNVGVLLAHWQIMQYKKRGDVNEKGAAVLTTVVSSRMLKAVAAAEGKYRTHMKVGAIDLHYASIFSLCCVLCSIRSLYINNIHIPSILTGHSSLYL